MAAVMFKIQTQYNKKEILKLQWMTGQKTAVRNLIICLAVGVIYIGLFIYNQVTGQSSGSLFHIGGNIVDGILIGLLAVCVGLIFLLPYLQARKVYKKCPGGVLKANFYFYQKNFQYGWGSQFETIPYSAIQEVRYIKDGIYLEANQKGYWIKDDFVIGEKENFLKFMESKNGKFHNAEK
ncbi:MAG TPA: YcxB family protein [Candidatus Blautia avistercoris]|uniref:YcxB family protein n=1 Tax=Blautia sp. An249 TaxID=1965603 RepID=UPI000B375749|nr:YcxB family protein [Blautia sp. An249]OUO78008.1 hypothetical protein B5F53_12445 [Blautia sp. An249]HIY18180.1 YcxB family protein [Candidatus Blautia avistercoris]